MQKINRFLTVSVALALVMVFLMTSLIPSAHAAGPRVYNYVLNCKGQGAASITVVQKFANAEQHFSNYCDPGQGAKYSWPVPQNVFGSLLYTTITVLVTRPGGIESESCTVSSQNGALYGFCSAMVNAPAVTLVQAEYTISVSEPTP